MAAAAAVMSIASVPCSCGRSHTSISSSPGISQCCCCAIFLSRVSLLRPASPLHNPKRGAARDSAGSGALSARLSVRSSQRTPQLAQPVNCNQSAAVRAAHERTRSESPRRHLSGDVNAARYDRRVWRGRQWRGAGRFGVGQPHRVRQPLALVRVRVISTAGRAGGMTRSETARTRRGPCCMKQRDHPLRGRDERAAHRVERVDALRKRLDRGRSRVGGLGMAADAVGHRDHPRTINSTPRREIAVGVHRARPISATAPTDTPPSDPNPSRPTLTTPTCGLLGCPVRFRRRRWPTLSYAHRTACGCSGPLGLGDPSQDVTAQHAASGRRSVERR